MGEIIKNVLVTAIVLFVMRLIMTGVERRRDAVRENIEGANSSNGKKGSNPLLSKKVIIEYGKGIKLLMLFGFIMFVTILLINIGDVFWGWKIGKDAGIPTIVIFSFITLFFAFCIGGTVFWRIKIDGDDIVYSDYLGIKHHYKWDEISKVLICAKKIKVYKGNRVIFTVDDNVPEGDYLIGIAKERNIPVELDDSFKKYCDKNGIKYQ